MVSLELKTGYLSRILENVKLSAFYGLLSRDAQLLHSGANIQNADEIYFGLINSLLSNDRVDFVKWFEKKSKSRPGKDSSAPFINDDFLIFALILGCSKFKLDSEWIRYILSIRTRNVITVTFENIINENFYSTSNSPEIVFMFLTLKEETITGEFINSTFIKISENITLFENRSDFQILCSVKSYDLIIKLKQIPDSRELDALREFNRKFTRRIKYFTLFVQAILFSALVYILIKVPKYSPEVVKYIEEYNYAFTIFGTLGLSLIGNLVPVFRKKSQQMVMRLLGYPKELLGPDK